MSDTARGILEGGSNDGEAFDIVWTDDGPAELHVVSGDEESAKATTSNQYRLQVDEYGQPMRDTFGQYRYRVVW